jgi:hypothetical protein
MEEFPIHGEVNTRTQMWTINGQPTGATMTSLLINGRPVPLDAFRRIPCEPIDGEPLGWVNYHWDQEGRWQDGGPLHVVWLNRDGELRRALVPAEAPEGEDPAAWRLRYDELAALPQFFIDI